MRQLLFTVTTLALAISPLAAQTLLQVTDAKDYKIEVDNEQVQVIHVQRAAHAVVPMHEHKLPFVVIYLKDDQAKITSAEGKVADSVHKAGDFVYNQPLKHEELHTFNGPLDVVLIELKAKPAPITIPTALDPLNADPKHHKVELENDRVRIIRSVREGHAKVPMHQHPAAVTVTLTDLETKMTLGDGTVSEGKRKAGEIIYRPGLKHAVENLSDRTSVELQVELK